MLVTSFAGRLGKDAELRTTQGGDKVLSFAVAVDRGFGETKTTLWLDCSIFGKRGESLAPHLTKGTSVAGVGDATLREFQRRDGSMDKALSVRVSEITLLGSPNGNGASNGGGYGANNGAGNGSGNNARSGNGGGQGGNGNSNGGGNGGGQQRQQPPQSQQRQQPPRQNQQPPKDDWDDEIPF